MKTTKRIAAVLSAGVLTFSMAACAEDEDPDVIVDEDTTTAPADPGDDTEGEDTEGEDTEGEDTEGDTGEDTEDDMTEDSTESP